MIVDGRTLAETLYARLTERVRVLGRAPVLTILTCAPNFETQKYLALKQKKAAVIGVETNVIELPSSSTTEMCIASIVDALPKSDGIIVQLPLPQTIDASRVIASVPPSHDIDALNPDTTATLSPVVGAIATILGAHAVVVPGKLVTVLGSGKLVGLPAYRWFTEQGAHVSIVNRDTADIPHYTKNADIVVCGIGVPGFLTPDMVREGVIILDAGTSEEGGELRGDADPRCAEKASLFTPVPGGIGPLTIAVLLKNVVELAEMKSSVV